MPEINRAKLFGKLNPLCYKAIESATVFAKMRGNPYVELLHWLHQMLQNQDCDLLLILKQYGIDHARLAQDMTAALDRLPRGAASISDLSSHVDTAVERAWVYATLMFGEMQVRSGHLMVGILKTTELRNALYQMSREFEKVKIDDLTGNFAALLKSSGEESLGPQDGSRMAGTTPDGSVDGAMAPAAMGKQEALQRFCVDLTQQARDGKIDPVVGRDEEVRQIVDILMRRRQNNPLLTGEAGVGKTAVVEGFARRIAEGDVPPPLKDVSLLTLDVGLLQAGASMKGEFEQRLRQVIDEVQASAKPIILFIDEAHTLVGAGGQAGTGDAANLLKPALARGTLRTIGATTWAEYKKYIEKDPALTRRFQVVQIPEPDEKRGILMLRGIANVMEQHHKVQVLDEAVEGAVRLSHRYIPARQLPDKAVSLLDTAAARVAIGLHAVPAEVEDSRRRIEALEREEKIIAREASIGIPVGDRAETVAADLATEKERLAGLETRWETEKGLVTRILDLRGKLSGVKDPATVALEAAAEAPATSAAEGADGAPPADAGPTPDPAGAAAAAKPAEGADREAILADLAKVQEELAELQGENPLMQPTVDAQVVAAVVSDWTGIPVGRMVKNEIAAVMELSERMGHRVIGQDHGLQMIAKRIQTSRAKLDNPNKPIGVFLLCGPSGVGKTETALSLAETLYGGEQNLITINMSEFQEAHTVSTLKGAPPGYVGYGEGGILTEAVRRRPYSVVLLDEVEKAHPDVHEIFFQVFDKGQMEDGEGRMIDFKNTLILLTSNVGSDLIMNLCKDPDLMPEPDGIATALREPLLKVFPAALLGRTVTIPYYPLSDAMLKAIIELQLGRIGKRIEGHYSVPFHYDDAVLDLVASRCTELESGGRMIDAILTNTVLPSISQEILGRMLQGESISQVRIGVADSDFTYAF